MQEEKIVDFISGGEYIVAYKVVSPTAEAGVYQSLVGTFGPCPAQNAVWTVEYRIGERTDAPTGTMGLYAFFRPWDAQTFARGDVQLKILKGEGHIINYTISLFRFAAPLWNLGRFYEQVDLAGGIGEMAAWPLLGWVEWQKMGLVFFSPIGTVLLADFTPKGEL
jgi:hypothetical protein